MLTLTEIYEELRDCEVVKTQTEFSEFCGMKPSWYSSHTCRRRGVGVATLYRLLYELTQVRDATIEDMNATTDVKEREAFKAGANAVDVVMTQIREEMQQRMEQ